MSLTEYDLAQAEIIPQASPGAEMFEIEAWCDMLSAMPGEMVELTGLEVRTIGGAVCVAAPGIPSTEFNRVVGLGVRSAADEDTIDRILAFYADRGIVDAWIQVMDSAKPSTLRGWLMAHGLAPAGPGWEVMECPPDRFRAVSPKEFVREIGAEHAAEAAQTFRIGYGLPPLFDPFVAALVGRPGWRTYCAFDHGRIIATAFLYQKGNRAALAGAGTVPDARRRGAQTALMNRRIRDASLDGVQVIQSHTWLPTAAAPNPSHANMIRCGLRPVHRRTNYSKG